MNQYNRRRYRINLLQLQTLCEENYARLMQLSRASSNAANDTLRLTMVLPKTGKVELVFWQQGRYTTDMQLQFAAEHPLLAKLNRVELVARLYHDMRLAEVIGMARQKRPQARQPYPNAAMQQPDEKHQWNRWLNEWLRHMLSVGEPEPISWRQLVTGTAE